MEVKYGIWLLVGAVCAIIFLLLALLIRPSKKGYKSGIIAANLELLKKDKYFKQKIIEYRALKVALIICLVLVTFMSFVMLARPIKIRTTSEDIYNRDIYLCLDISTSVDDLNMKLCKELENTVRELSGERVGIVLFNTSPVLISPLTDDYEFIIEQLEKIRTGIKKVRKGNPDYKDLLYWDSYLDSGTLIGNKEKGSSLIADGLLGAAFNFSELDKERTRIIILSTDNDPYGEQMVSLGEAAQICADNNIIVYGIGTKEMTNANLVDMKNAVELTGGKFYLEEDAGSMNSIIEGIQSTSATLTKGRKIITETDYPTQAYKYLVILFVIMTAVSIILMRPNEWWIVRYALMAVLLLAIMAAIVLPSAEGNAIGNERKHYNQSSNTRVLFVIDDTISMLARDYDGNTERLVAAKQDLAKIIYELEGAGFSVISFHNTGNVLTPYTNNAEHVKNVIDSIYPPEDVYAKGSSFSVVKEPLRQNLEESLSERQIKPYVFFVSDGEITDESILESYEDLAPYISGGAVLGYGTDKGGEMFINVWYEEEPRQIMYWDAYEYGPAKSYIDEDNLKSIAKDMGLTYINMNDGHGLDNVVSKIRADVDKSLTIKIEDEKDNTTNYIDNVKPNYWYFLFVPFVILLFAEAIDIAKRK